MGTVVYVCVRYTYPPEAIMTDIKEGAQDVVSDVDVFNRCHGGA